MGWNNSEFARRLRQHDDVSATRAYEIDRSSNKRREKQLGTKQLVIDQYIKSGKNAARKLFDELNKHGYPEEVFETWIAEFDFQNAVKQEYIRNGEESAGRLFNERNNQNFNGKFKKGTFINWIKEAHRKDGNEGR